MIMEWYEYESWWTLRDGPDRAARLYKPGHHPQWSVALMKVGEGRENIHLDPTLTEDEAKAVVVTLARSQL
jgi:mannose/cellobiose epimerase-like protein (N-acyl-D-glucosamine 2-epimerase family)